MPGVELSWEKWAEFGEEAILLGRLHFEEVEGTELARHRPYRPSYQGMAKLCELGFMLCLAARDSGELIGYFTWNVVPDLESEALLIAQQGAWFVHQRYRRTNVGVRMFDESVVKLRSLGCSHAFLHHRTLGAGRNIGRFFQRRGAIPMQTTYSLFLGKD